MRNMIVQAGKPWTRPVLRVLAPSDERMRAAAHRDPAFAAALRRCCGEVEDGGPRGH